MDPMDGRSSRTPPVVALGGKRTVDPSRRRPAEDPRLYTVYDPVKNASDSIRLYKRRIACL